MVSTNDQVSILFPSSPHPYEYSVLSSTNFQRSSRLSSRRRRHEKGINLIVVDSTVRHHVAGGDGFEVNDVAIARSPIGHTWVPRLPQDHLTCVSSQSLR